MWLLVTIVNITFLVKILDAKLKLNSTDKIFAETFDRKNLLADHPIKDKIFKTVAIF